jgi:hypothetical protein
MVEPGSQKETDLTENYLLFHEYIFISVEKIRTSPKKIFSQINFMWMTFYKIIFLHETLELLEDFFLQNLTGIMLNFLKFFLIS